MTFWRRHIKIGKNMKTVKVTDRAARFIELVREDVEEERLLILEAYAEASKLLIDSEGEGLGVLTMITKYYELVSELSRESDDSE